MSVRRKRSVKNAVEGWRAEFGRCSRSSLFLARMPKSLRILFTLILLIYFAEIFSGFAQADQKLSLTGKPFFFDHPIYSSSSIPNVKMARNKNRKPLRGDQVILQRAENPEENDHQDETSPEEGKDEEREKDNSQTSFQAEQDVLAASHQWNESNQADAISAGALSRGAANRRILATNDGREALVEALNRASVSEGNERERIERESNEREIIERVRGGGDQQERQQLIIIRDAVRDENQGGQQNQENLDEQRQQNQDDNPNHLVGRRVIMLDERAAMWKFGSVHSVVSLGSRPDEAVLKVQYADGDSANFRLSELLPSLRPINAAEDNITQGANKVLWKGIFRKFKLVREKLLQGRDFEKTAQEESFIRELLNKPTGVLTHATVKTKFKELWNMYHPDKYSGKNYPKRYIYAISAVLHATRYTCELYEYNAERGSERPTISKPKLVDYPEYGSEDYKSKADMMADEVEEIFSQEEPIPRHRRAEPQENPEERHSGGGGW